MARLTNKQLEIVVDEIYNQVSLPVIKQNKADLDAIEIEDDEYLLDCKLHKMLQVKIDDIEKQRNIISKKYKNETINGYELGGWNVMSNSKPYINHLKMSEYKPKDYSSKSDIEREIILSGNSDIPALIETIVNKLK